MISTPRPRWYASSRFTFASSFAGCKSIARRKFKTVLDKSASRSCVSVTNRASPITPSRPAGTRRRDRSGSFDAMASSRAVASFRLIAIRGSKSAPPPPRDERRATLAAPYGTGRRRQPRAPSRDAEGHDLVRVPERLVVRRRAVADVIERKTSSQRATSTATRASTTASPRLSRAAAPSAIHLASVLPTPTSGYLRSPRAALRSARVRRARQTEAQPESRASLDR